MALSKSAIINCIIAFTFCGFVAYTAEPGSSRFSWHPTLMTFAFMVLVTQAVCSISPSSIFSSRGGMVRAHWMLMLAAVVSALLGFLSVYWTKIDLGKPHFTSPHGVLGVVTVVYFLVQLFAGVNLLLFPSLIAKSIPIGTVKRAHGFSGVFLFLLASLVLVGGVNSDWFKARVTGAVWYLCLAAPVVVWGLLAKQVVAGSAASAKKRP